MGLDSISTAFSSSPESLLEASAVILTNSVSGVFKDSPSKGSSPTNIQPFQRYSVGSNSKPSAVAWGNPASLAASSSYIFKERLVTFQIYLSYSSSSFILSPLIVVSPTTSVPSSLDAYPLTDSPVDKLAPFSPLRHPYLIDFINTKEST